MKTYRLLSAAAVALIGSSPPAPATAQSTRVTVLRNAPVTTVALPYSSASVQVNSPRSGSVAGQRIVVLTKPVTAVALPGTRADVRVSSN